MSANISPTNGSKPVADGAPVEQAAKTTIVPRFDISSIQSLDAPKGVLGTLWSGVKSVANFFHWMATKFVDILCLRFLYRSDASELKFEIKEFDLKINKICDWSLDVEKKEKIFKQLPKEFQSKTFEFFTQISDKKITTFQQLHSHPRFVEGLNLLREKFEWIYIKNLYEKALKKTGAPKENLALFLDLFEKSNKDRQTSYLYGLDSTLALRIPTNVQAEESLKRMTTNFETLLTKERFEKELNYQVKRAVEAIKDTDVKLENLNKRN